MDCCLNVINEKLEVSLKEVKLLDSKFLYELLKNRDPLINISHKKLPTYDKHKKFVKSYPYSKWYIINYKKRKVGTIYISKQNEIGLFLTNEFQREHIGTNALNLLIQKNPCDRYLANVSPKNIKSQKFFKKNGFKLVQYTYELST